MSYQPPPPEFSQQPPQGPQYAPQQQPMYQQPPQGQQYDPRFAQPMQSPMPPQPLRRPRRWPWIVALIVVFFIGFGLGHIGTGGGTAAVQNTATIQTTATHASTAPQQTPQTSNTGHHKIGETVNVDDIWQVTVTGAKTNQGDDIMHPKAGHAFLSIDVSMKNISSSQQAASSLIQYSLRDTAGQQYNETIATNATSPDGPVNAGAPLKGTLTYEVPTSTKSFVLGFIATLTGQQASWDITA
ncbi:MAG: DUF4352 domain-containing protein [Chloroflexota bacterium]|nr:DUF4352 domain-containing protein [Chloroflexota bacterium]